MDKVRIFIGSGEASILERKTLIYSIKKNTSRELDIYVFNGTHNSIEYNDEPPYLAPMTLEVKYQNFTEFSNYRWYIPQICNYQGKAIWLDSDTVCLGDIGILFDTDMDNNDLLAVSGSYDNSDSGQTFATSVLLMDCSRCNFDIDLYVREINEGKYDYYDLARMTKAFLDMHPFNVGAMDPGWNVFDRCDDTTSLIHYTNLLQQPWKFTGHKFGHIWFEYFTQAITSGYISEGDIRKAIYRGHARKNIMDGNYSRTGCNIRKIINRLFSK